MCTKGTGNKKAMAVVAAPPPPLLSHPPSYPRRFAHLDVFLVDLWEILLRGLGHNDDHARAGVDAALKRQFWSQRRIASTNQHPSRIGIKLSMPGGGCGVISAKALCDVEVKRERESKREKREEMDTSERERERKTKTKR